ncbi:MAG: DUF4924 family protein [Bacteroidota bacterium]|nr:DUF4924 family protein [Bacteroidota bacterium]
MLIAKEIRKTNIAEYILYLWQVEDLLRACYFEPDKIEQQLVSRFKADETASKEIADWYNNLSVMMEKEHVRAKGHLQVLANLVNDLNEFHLRMLEVQKDQEYIHLYRQNRDAIGDLMQRMETTVENEVEVCLNALYGYMVLKLKNSEISELTQKTMEGFGRLIGHLSARYIQFENDDFEF